LFVEFRVPEPILPPGLFRIRNFAVAGALGFLLGIAYLGFVPFLPLYLQDIFGLTTAQAGMKLMPVLVSMAATALVVGRVINRYGYHKPFPVLGALIMTVALIAIARLTPAAAPWSVNLSLGLLGVGMGMVSQILVLFAQDSVRQQDIGVATSSIAMFRTIGSVVGAAIFGAKLAALPALSPSDAGPYALAEAVRSGLELAVGAAILACLLACAFREIKER
jgi:MFS family permease